jgi:iron complex outermembrane receptor protein
MNQKVRAGSAGAVLAMLFAPDIAAAQRTSENAVTSADDAFGTSVGLETTGIYSETDTRGFSPLKAGNARIDGLYYDPVAVMPYRLRAATAIRVGFAAEGYPFHAPTGIVEYQLRPFPTRRGLSLAYSHTPFGAPFLEADLRLPIVPDHIGLTAGAAYSDTRNSDGARRFSKGVTVRPIFRYGGAEFAPFHSILRYYDDSPHPLAVVTETYLPKFPKKRRFLGQRWAAGSYDSNQTGFTFKAPITGHLSVRAGLFRAIGDRDENYSEIFSLVSPSGLANHRLISDPPQDIRSTSGEAQVAWRIGEGKVQHRLIAGFRGRNRLTDFGGSDIRNFGQVIYGNLDKEPEPVFNFSRPNEGRVRQSSFLLGYLGRIEGVGSLNLGIQKARYRATSRDGRTGIISESSDDTWLYNAILTVDLNRLLSFYVGTERGLEDSGTAPENAANRNEQLPATQSTQYEGGVRWKFPGGQWVVNAFQITKPYFAFDEDSVFTQFGDVRHRGIETSLSGLFGKRLYVLAGAVLMQPRVTGTARDLGLVGRRPVGTPTIFARADINYRTDIFGGLTPTASLIYTGKRPVGSRPLAALGGGQLMVPGAATVDLGARQQFKIGKIPASFRAVMNNVLDKRTWKVVAANTLYTDERRRFTITLTVDL